MDARRALAGLALMVGCAVTRPLAFAPRATSLHLRFHGPAGESVRINRARMLVDFWGAGEEVPLAVDGSELIVDLDRSWFTARWPHPSTDGVRLFVSADGYAPMLSTTFGWLGITDPDRQIVTAEAKIQFRDQSITVRTGETRTWNVAFRRLQPRTLRVIDQADRPVANIGVNVYMYWARSNHCGMLEGTPLVSGTRTDAQGRLPLPDGDFDYGIDVPNSADAVVFDDESVFFQRMVTPAGLETTVRVHKFDRRVFDVEVTDGTQSVSDARLVGLARYAGCMDQGVRPLGQTGADGRLKSAPMSADEFTDLVLCRANTEVWRGTAIEWLSKPGVRITLSPTYSAANTPFNVCSR